MQLETFFPSIQRFSASVDPPPKNSQMIVADAICSISSCRQTSNQFLPLAAYSSFLFTILTTVLNSLFIQLKLKNLVINLRLAFHSYPQVKVIVVLTTLFKLRMNCSYLIKLVRLQYSFVQLPQHKKNNKYQDVCPHLIQQRKISNQYDKYEYPHLITQKSSYEQLNRINNILFQSDIYIFEINNIHKLTSNMQSDQLLIEWKQAKQTCKKVIDISIQSNIYKTATTKQSSQQFMKVYDVVYRLCSNRETQQTRVAMVYKDYKQMLKSALVIMAKEMLQERDIFKLKMVRRIFDAYEDILKRLKHMFAYLNRPFHLKQGKIDDLDRTGMVLIVNTLFTDENLMEYDTIYFKQLSKIRKNKDFTDSQILKDYVQILYKFHLRLAKKQNKKARTLYTDFQQKYLTDARQYYNNFYSKLQQLSPSQYFVEVNNLYDLEKRITQECFGTSSDSFINKIFATQFLQQYRDKLIQSNKGLKYILQNRQVQAVSIISNLYKKLTNSIDGFKQPFQNFVYEQITSLLVQVQTQLAIKKIQDIYVKFIQKLIQKNNQLQQILQAFFLRYNQFIGYYKTGVERSFAKNQLVVPVQEMLATYVDAKFKDMYRHPDLMKEDVKNIKDIFECIQNKDLFLIKYLQKLGKRLMTLKMQALENHQNLIFYLKMHSGNKLAERLESIVDEYKMSLQHDGQFLKVQKANNLPYYITLRIFSESIWPFPDIIEFKPEQLSQIFSKGMKCIKLYEVEQMKKKSFKISFGDSRIRWMYYFEKEVENKHPQASFETNGVQAVLLQYIYQHRPDKISLRVLSQVFPQIKATLIKQSLTKMTQMVENILIKTQKQDDIFYEFNRLMKSRKIKIQYDGFNQDQEEEQQLFQKNELGKQRQYTIDANIAKLMKTKKILGIDKIIQQVTKMIKVFNPGVRDIKSSLERLLTKQLVVRDDKDKNLIKYKD